jgi:hypothetical protein
MSEAKTYEGGCHCGKVRYRATTDLAKVIECNCSICSKKGHLLTFLMPDQFELLAGENATTDYQFNKKKIHHLFCPTCGVGSYGWGLGPGGQKMYSVNVRCLQDVELSALNITRFDGKSL